MGTILDPLGSAWEPFGRLWDGSEGILADLLNKNAEKLGSRISTPLSNGMLTFEGPGCQKQPWVGKFGCQEGQSGGQGGKKGARSGQSGRLFRVGGEVVCQSYGTRRNSAENQVTSEVKVYLTDKSYD